LAVGELTARREGGAVGYFLKLPQVSIDAP
jgi:hypothetical protein